MHLIAQRMDAGPSRMAAIGYIPSYKPRNPKPVAKLLEDNDAWDRLIDEIRAYIDSFATKRGAARQVKPFVISIIDTLNAEDSKESKVCLILGLAGFFLILFMMYSELIVLKEKEEGPRH